MNILLITPLFLNKIGATEIILIVILFVVLFGAKKIPDLMRGAGRGVREFKDALNKDYSSEEQNKKPENTDTANTPAEKSETTPDQK